MLAIANRFFQPMRQKNGQVIRRAKGRRARGNPHMNPAPQAKKFARWIRRRSIPRHKNGRPDRLPRDASGPRARSRSRARRLRAGGRLPLGATPCHQHHQLGGSDLTQLDTLASKIATSCFQIQPRELAVQAALTAKSRQSLLLLRKGPRKKSGH